MHNEPAYYTSYLVRVWQEETEPPTVGHWRAEVEHVQSGVRQRFAAPADLWAFLRQLEPKGDDNHANER